MILYSEMRGYIFLITVFSLCACKSVSAKSEAGAAVPPVSYGAERFASARRNKNAGALPDAVLTEREGRADVSYEVLEEGSYGAGFGTAVIENQDDLNKLYELLHGSGAAAPKIDFNRKKVIAVCAGTFSTGGYGIRLHSAIDTKDGLETVFVITSPSPSQIVTQAFTTPYLIISIDVPSAKKVSVRMERGKPEFSLQGD